MNEEHEVRGLLLAGGRSRRMGIDKRLIRIGNETMVGRSFRALEEAFGPPWVLVADESDVAKLSPILGDKVIFRIDPRPLEGPLPAVAEALEALDCPYAFVLAADMPGASASFLRRFDGLRRRIVGNPSAIVAIASGKAQVTCAFYRSALAGHIRSVARKGGHCLAESLRQPEVRVHYLDSDELAAVGGERMFVNLNTPEEHERYRKEGAHGL